jgi:hypothetical protein
VEAAGTSVSVPTVSRVSRISSAASFKGSRTKMFRVNCYMEKRCAVLLVIVCV